MARFFRTSKLEFKDTGYQAPLQLMMQGLQQDTAFRNDQFQKIDAISAGLNSIPTLFDSDKQLVNEHTKQYQRELDNALTLATSSTDYNKMNLGLRATNNKLAKDVQTGLLSAVIGRKQAADAWDAVNATAAQEDPDTFNKVRSVLFGKLQADTAKDPYTKFSGPNVVTQPDWMKDFIEYLKVKKPSTHVETDGNYITSLTGISSKEYQDLFMSFAMANKKYRAYAVQQAQLLGEGGWMDRDAEGNWSFLSPYTVVDAKGNEITNLSNLSSKALQEMGAHQVVNPRHALAQNATMLGESLAYMERDLEVDPTRHHKAMEALGWAKLEFDKWQYQQQQEVEANKAFFETLETIESPTYENLGQMISDLGNTNPELRENMISLAEDRLNDIAKKHRAIYDKEYEEAKKVLDYANEMGYTIEVVRGGGENKDPNEVIKNGGLLAFKDGDIVALEARFPVENPLIKEGGVKKLIDDALDPRNSDKDFLATLRKQTEELAEDNQSVVVNPFRNSNSAVEPIGDLVSTVAGWFSDLADTGSQHDLLKDLDREIKTLNAEVQNRTKNQSEQRIATGVHANTLPSKEIGHIILNNTGTVVNELGVQEAGKPVATIGKLADPEASKVIQELIAGTAIIDIPHTTKGGAVFSVHTNAGRHFQLHATPQTQELIGKLLATQYPELYKAVGWQQSGVDSTIESMRRPTIVKGISISRNKTQQILSITPDIKAQLGLAGTNVVIAEHNPQSKQIDYFAIDNSGVRRHLVSTESVQNTTFNNPSSVKRLFVDKINNLNTRR